MHDEIEVPPLSVQLQMAEAAAKLQEIAIREAALAGAAAKNPNEALGDADVDALVAMAMTMDDELAAGERHADFLRRTFEQFGPWVNQQAGQALASDHFEPAQVEQISDTLKVEDGDFSALGFDLAGTVLETVPGSRKELRDAAFAFRRRAVSEIDWHQVGCTMIDLSIMGGLATCFETAGAGCVVALGGTIAHAGLCS